MKNIMALFFALGAALALLAGCGEAGGSGGEGQAAASPFPPLETQGITGTVYQTSGDERGGTLTLTLADGSHQRFTYTGESRFDCPPGQLQPGDQLRLEVSGDPALVVAATITEKATEEPGTGEDRIFVADASLYRGTVIQVSLQEGVGSFTLARAAGTHYGQEEMTFTVDEGTRFSYPLEKLTEGAYVEVFYSGEASPAAAIASNYLGVEELVVYNGTLLGVQQEEDGSKSLVMGPLNSEPFCGNSTLEELYPLAEIVFHVGDSTQFYLSEDRLVLGTRLNILHTGATTRSLPPQGNALEVRLWKEG